jgi:hypothetical protein
MPQQFDGLGLRLMYPDNWKVEDETDDSATIESPGGAFMSISRFPIGPSADEILAEATTAMEGEYEITETSNATVEIAGRSIPSRSLHFTYLDFEVTAKLQALITDESTYLIQTQGEDREMDELAVVFLAMQTSLCQSLDN